MEPSQGHSSGCLAARESNKTETQPAARALQLSLLPKGDFYHVPSFFPLQSYFSTDRQGVVFRKNEHVLGGSVPPWCSPCGVMEKVFLSQGSCLLHGIKKNTK